MKLGTAEDLAGVDMALLPVQRYRRPTGEPTCGRDFKTGAVCPFLAGIRFGVDHRCYLCGMAPVSDTGSGYLDPHERCPLWSEPAGGPGEG